jgi:hypothetical protein
MPDDNYGFVVISFDDYKDGCGDCGCGNEGCKVKGGPIIGMFRIIDQLGYEYRTNAAGKKVPSRNSYSSNGGSMSYGGYGYNNQEMLVNFNLANGNNLSDLVGITFLDTSPTTVTASPAIAIQFGDVSFVDPVLIYNENENATSCDPLIFACEVGFLDKGIDFSLPNSKAQANQACTTNRLATNTSGWLHLPFEGFSCAPPFSQFDGSDPTFKCISKPFFVGFRGLNNGDGTGGMDSWWVQRRQDFHHEDNGPPSPK